MKGWVLILAACMLIGQITNAASYSANHNRVVAYFKSAEEKSVLAAIWTGEQFFAVGRINNGSKQDGFAMYVCAVLDDYGFKGNKINVSVIDIVKLTQTEAWEVIGRARCK